MKAAGIAQELMPNMNIGYAAVLIPECLSQLPKFTLCSFSLSFFLEGLHILHFEDSHKLDETSCLRLKVQTCLLSGA